MGMSDQTKGGLLSSAGSLIGTGINAVAQGSMNKKTREWNEKQYALQRENALSDWNMQNEYNSPGKQMERLKAAGLNPNLVYGNGAEANSSSMPRQAAAPSWNPKAPEFPAGSVSGKYFDTLIQKQTLTNMDAQEKLIRQQALSAAADVVSKGVNTNRSKLAYDIEQATRENVIANVGYRNDLLAAQRNVADETTNYTMGKINQLATQLQLLNERVSLTKSQKTQVDQAIENAKKDGTLKAFEIKLNKKGITKSDPAYLRLLNELLDSFTD